jgi:hypothetical protein
MLIELYSFVYKELIVFFRREKINYENKIKKIEFILGGHSYLLSYKLP